MKLSVITLSWDNLNYTKAFVKSIRENTSLHYELIIVDNGSEIETQKWVEENADKLINNNPITIKEEDNITTMIKSTQNHNFPISFMPVLNNNNNLVGTITFFNLINSES